MIFLSFYTTIDGFFVAHYAGSDALAGINIVIPITCIIFGVSVMLATGSGAVIGELSGRKNHRKACEVFSFMCVVLLLFSVLFTGIGILFLKPIAYLLGSSERLLEHVLPYAFITFLGTLPMAFKLYFEYLVRSDGSSETGLIMSVMGLVLNIILDYIFVGILGTGTFGAALGTTISISISALIGFIYFLKYGQIGFCGFKADLNMLIKSCANGSSEMLTELSTGITTFLFNIIIMNYYGENGIAAVTIIMYVYYFFISFYMGITVAAAPVVSYNLGTRNPEKIREILKHSFLTIGISSCVILSVLLTGGPAIIRLFVASGTVFDITWDGLRLFSPVFLFIGINVFLSGYFTALGNGAASAAISSLRSLFLVIVFVLALPPVIGTAGIWLAMPLSEAATILIALRLYHRKGTIHRIFSF